MPTAAGIIGESQTTGADEVGIGTVAGSGESDESSVPTSERPAMSHTGCLRRRSLDWAGAHVVVFKDEEVSEVGYDVEGSRDLNESEPSVSVSGASESPWLRSLELSSTPPSLHAIQSWDFDVLAYTEAALVPAVSQMFEHYDLLSTFVVDPEVLANFVTAAMHRHNPHEYHNWHHGVSCTHASFLLLSLAGGDEFLTQADIFATLFGALVHDVDHAGHSNDFEVKSGTDRAKKYGNDAVLEKHSIDVTLDEILALPGCDIFAGMRDEDAEYIRRIARDVIISTDPAKHGDLLQEMAKLAEDILPEDDDCDSGEGGAESSGGVPVGPSNRPLSHPTWTKDDAASRTLLCRMIVHAADISNPVHNSSAVALDWCHRISAEFRNQAILERELGLQVASYMDGLEDEYRIAKLQVGFYDFMAMPFFRVVGILLPKSAHLVLSGDKNKGKYQEIVDLAERNK